MRSRLRAPIAVLAGRYRGRLYCWDVGHGAVADHGDALLRPRRWLEVVASVD